MADTEQKTKQHFNLGHLKLIAGSVAVILLITWVKGGFSFEKKQTAVTKNYTYEQAQSEAIAKESVSLNQTSSKAKNELALLDPNFASGSVLGTSTGTEATMESVFSESATPIPKEILDSIPVITNKENNQNGIIKYMQEYSETEYQNDAPGILIGLNSDSSVELQGVPQKVEDLLKALLQVEVPSELSDYHRLKMLYYVELRTTALIDLNIEKEQNAENVSQLIFSISQEIKKQQQNIYKKYVIRL